MDVEKASDLKEWVKLVEDVGKSWTHHGHHSNIVHEIITFALASSGNASIIKSNDDFIEMTRKISSISSIHSVLSPQIRPMFSQGLSIFIEKLINHEDVDNLGRILMWTWSVYETELWQIVSFQYLYQSILIKKEHIKTVANMKFQNTMEEKHMFCARPSVITAATVAILSSLSFSHRPSYSLMVINSLRKVLNIYLEGQNQSFIPSCLFSFDIFITLYRACIPHSKSHSISMFVEILTTIAQYDNKDDKTKASLHECFVSMLEALAENSCQNDILPTLSSHLAPIFASASLHHRTRIMTVLLNRQFSESSVLSEFKRFESFCFHPTTLSILQQLLGIIGEQTTLFCAHHEIGNYQGFSNGIYQSTLLASVYKTNFLLTESGNSNDWSIDALLAPTLASTILESKSKETDINEKLSYILKCIEVRCLLDSVSRIHSEEGVSNPIHDKHRLNSTLLTRQGVLLSIQHDPDDIDEEESSSHVKNDGIQANKDNNKAFNWQEVCSSEESLWRWVCRPSEVHVTLSDAKSFGNETSLDDLLQVIIERLLVCKYLIHRLVHYWSAMQSDENELRLCAERIYVGMEQIIAQVTFCKNLISLGKAMVILQEQRGKQVSLPSKQTRTVISTTASIRIFNILQSHANTICETIPLPLWKECIAFALTEDPCVLYTGTMFLLLETFALIGNRGDSFDATQEALERSIVEIIWSHVPLWWQSLESLRKDKHYFKRLRFLSVYSAAASGSDEVYLTNTGIMDPIEKALVHGELVKHADYRWFVSTLFSCLATVSGRFPLASDEFVSIVAQEHQQSPPCEGDIPGEIQSSIQPTKLLLDIIVSHRNKTCPPSEIMQPRHVEEDYVDSIIAALKTSSATSHSKNDADASTNVTTLCCLHSYMDVAQDGLILSCLLHLMHRLTLAQSAGVHSATDAGFYTKSLWQVQRQLITDYAGLETLMQGMYVYQYQYQATDVRAVEVSWLALLYRGSWGFVTQCIRHRVNDAKSQNLTGTEQLAPLSCTNASAAISTISVLEESFSRQVSNNGLLIFHSGYLLRVWWEQWFEQETVEREVGLHLLLSNLTKVYELMGQKVDEKLSQEPHFGDEEDDDDDIQIHGELFHSLDATLSRKRPYEEGDTSVDAETVDVLPSKRPRGLLFSQDPHQTRIIPNLPEFHTSLWFANLYDASIPDAVAMESLDHCLDMILRLFLTLRPPSPAGCASEDTSSAAAWYILHLQLWHTLQAWFMTHFPPPARHIVHLAQWTQHWVEDRLLPRLEALQALLARVSDIADVGVSGDGGSDDTVEDEQRVVLELFLLATMLQAAQRFFGILLTVLKTTQHLAYKLCTQVQEDCGQLVDHIVTVCRPYVSSDRDTAVEGFEEEEDRSHGKLHAWILEARLLCDALLHSCAHEKWSLLVHETLVLPCNKDTRPSPDDTDAIQHSEDSFLSRWLQIMKKRLLQPYIQANVTSFLRKYET